MIEFIVKKEDFVLKSISEECPAISFNVLNKLLRKKDIKINDKRINSNVKVYLNDKVSVYIDSQTINNFNKIYEDENVLIINKSSDLEVSGKGSLEELLQKENKDIKACHRLDRNTTGLVIFSKNEESHNEILRAFSDNDIKKYYVAFIKGVMGFNNKTLKAYLFKDAKKAQVFISNKKTVGSREIITNVKHIKTIKGNSLIEIEIPTGRTHQIRAHLNFINHSIIGDEKYGDTELNKNFKLKKQCLCAYKLVFSLKQQSKLEYLNKLQLKIDISFLKYINT